MSPCLSPQGAVQAPPIEPQAGIGKAFLQRTLQCQRAGVTSLPTPRRGSLSPIPREDIQFAQEISLAIAGGKFDLILDVHGIDGGEDWRSSLRELILSSDTVVFVLTEKSADSAAYAWELAEASKLDKRLLVVTPHVLPRDLKLPPQLAEIQSLKSGSSWRRVMLLR